MSAIKSAIFDVDGTLVDSVDLHAAAWQRSFAQFGHSVSFEQVRGQIGKGSDKLIPTFLSDAERCDHAEAMTQWREALFDAEYLGLVRPFSAVPDLLRRLRDTGWKVAVASSAKQKQLDAYLDIAGIADLVDAATSSDDVGASKPDPDIFHAALDKLGADAAGAMVVGDTPYDVTAAKRAGIPCIGVLSGCFAEADLREAGAIAIYPGPAAILACFERSPFATRR